MTTGFLCMGGQSLYTDSITKPGQWRVRMLTKRTLIFEDYGIFDK